MQYFQWPLHLAFPECIFLFIRFDILVDPFVTVFLLTLLFSIMSSQFNSMTSHRNAAVFGLLELVDDGECGLMQQ